MEQLRINLLGGLEIQRAGADCPLPFRKAAALLVFLSLNPDRPQSREKLAALLWEDSAEAQARSSLRQALSAIRRIVPPGVIEAEHDWVRLHRGSVETDVAEFEATLAVGGTAYLMRAVDIFRGELLDGFYVRSKAFEAWMAVERQLIQSKAIAAMVALLEETIDRGTADLHVPAALRILALDATQETLHRALMRYYAMRGQRVAALRQYSHCREALGREFGTDPETETQELYQHILRQDFLEQNSIDGRVLPRALN